MEIKKVKFGNIKEMLTKDQMKKIKGGILYKCCSNANCPCGGSSNWHSGCNCGTGFLCCNN